MGFIGYAELLDTLENALQKKASDANLEEGSARDRVINSALNCVPSENAEMNACSPRMIDLALDIVEDGDRKQKLQNIKSAIKARIKE